MPLQIFGKRAPDVFRHREVGFLRKLTQRGQERLREKEVCPNHAYIIHTKYMRHLRRRPLPPRPEVRGFSGVQMKLISNWRDVLRRGWSVRFIVAFIVLELAGVGLSVRGAFSDNEALSLALQLTGAALGIAAFVARLTYQRGLSDGK